MSKAARAHAAPSALQDDELAQVRGGTIFRVDVETEPPVVIMGPNDKANVHQNIGVPDGKTHDAPNPVPKF
jgi:hypothetical protein